jgi:RecJ-like exonuclease
MTKVRILTTCSHCGGKAYLPISETIDAKGKPYIQHQPCPMCEGSGMAPKWISMQEFIALLSQAQCPHQHTSYKGSLHFCAGDLLDNITEVCDGCGAILERQTLGDYIHDPETIPINR